MEASGVMVGVDRAGDVEVVPVHVKSHKGYHQPAFKTDLAGSPHGAVTANRLVLGGDVHILYGWAIAETTGAAGAAVRLYDGNGVGGEVFCRINLAANESTREQFTVEGVKCSTGRVFLEVASGSVEGVLYWR